jgi:hypothetical protein
VDKWDSFGEGGWELTYHGTCRSLNQDNPSKTVFFILLKFYILVLIGLALILQIPLFLLVADKPFFPFGFSHKLVVSLYSSHVHGAPDAFNDISINYI